MMIVIMLYLQVLETHDGDCVSINSLPLSQCRTQSTYCQSCLCFIV